MENVPFCRESIVSFTPNSSIVGGQHSLSDIFIYRLVNLTVLQINKESLYLPLPLKGESVDSGTAVPVGRVIGRVEFLFS